MNIQSIKRRRLLWVCAVSGFVLLMLCLTVAFHIFKSPINVPGDLPVADKRKIVRLARLRTLTSAFEELRQGEVQRCIRALRVLPKQEINELRKNSDGTYRAYVVVFSTNEPDGSGFYAWWRHQLIKTNGDWVIVRSY
jgi:hypothetical protein